MRPFARLVMAGGVMLALTIALSGCGVPPWEQAGTGDGSTPSPTPSDIEVITNDLATGSTQRQLQAGDIELTIDYWSTLDMGDWLASANKPLSFSMSASLGTDTGQRVYLSKVTIVTSVAGPGGSALPAPANLTDQASVSPGYFVKEPYSYSQTFVLPALDSEARSITLSITYELLLQTTPQSSEYAKQTAADTITISIARP